MSKWMNTIDVSRCWEEAKEKPILIKEVCKDIIKGLKKLKIPEEYNYDRYELKERFESFLIDEEISVEEFDFAFNELYDFCDISLDDDIFNGRRIAWVNIFKKD